MSMVAVINKFSKEIHACNKSDGIITKETKYSHILIKNYYKYGSHHRYTYSSTRYSFNKSIYFCYVVDHLLCDI